MIVRSGVADLHKLLQVIVDTNILGPPDDNELSLFKLMYPDIQSLEKKERDSEGQKNPDGSISPSHNLFGFWLPHCLSADPERRATEVAACMQLFREIEDAFANVEGKQNVRRIIGDLSLEDYVGARHVLILRNQIVVFSDQHDGL